MRIINLYPKITLDKRKKQILGVTDFSCFLTDIEIINIHKNADQTSIDVSWTMTSQNCQDLPTRQDLSYDCSCSPYANKWKHSELNNPD